VRKIEFTPQEIKIIKLICEQKTSKEIGARMGLKFRTIEDYRNKIQRKIRAKNSIGVALYAVKAIIYKVK
jgi:DNA-binding NarL/FixJ family response regulator